MYLKVCWGHDTAHVRSVSMEHTGQMDKRVKVLIKRAACSSEHNQLLPSLHPQPLTFVTVTCKCTFPSYQFYHKTPLLWKHLQVLVVLTPEWLPPSGRVEEGHAHTPQVHLASPQEVEHLLVK